MYTAVFIFWRRSAQLPNTVATTLRNPFSISVALKFGLLLVLIMFLSQFLTQAYGDTGIYVLAAASGIADVDAITLSIVNMVSVTDVVSIETAAKGILIASIVNSLVKAGIALFIGQMQLGLRVGLTMLLALGSGLFLV
jgi:uncharacterized membrane protein (DUF4010 family)